MDGKEKSTHIYKNTFEIVLLIYYCFMIVSNAEKEDKFD